MEMNKIALSILAVGISFSGFTIASDRDYSSSDDYKKDHYDSYHDKYKHKKKKRLVLNLIGTGEMYKSLVPDIDGDGQKDEAMCFDVGLVDAKNGKIIGTARDCLSNVNPGDNGGLKLVGTTFFHLPYGKIVTRGLTTVQPVNEPTVTPDGVSISHITGASSDQNSVLKAKGKFRHHRGTVRLSGMVDLTAFNGEEGSPITFDCLFVIDLEKKRHHRPYNYHYNRYDDGSYDDYSTGGY